MLRDRKFGNEIYRYKYAVLNKDGECEAVDNEYDYLVSILPSLATIRDVWSGGERLNKEKLKGLKIVELNNESREKIIKD